MNLRPQRDFRRPSKASEFGDRGKVVQVVPETFHVFSTWAESAEFGPKTALWRLNPAGAQGSAERARSTPRRGSPEPSGEGFRKGLGESCGAARSSLRRARSGERFGGAGERVSRRPPEGAGSGRNRDARGRRGLERAHLGPPELPLRSVSEACEWASVGPESGSSGGPGLSPEPVPPTPRPRWEPRRRYCPGGCDGRACVTAGHARSGTVAALAPARVVGRATAGPGRSPTAASDPLRRIERRAGLDVRCVSRRAPGRGRRRGTRGSGSRPRSPDEPVDRGGRGTRCRRSDTGSAPVRQSGCWSCSVSSASVSRVWESSATSLVIFCTA